MQLQNQRKVMRKFEAHLGGDTQLQQHDKVQNPKRSTGKKRAKQKQPGVEKEVPEASTFSQDSAQLESVIQKAIQV